MTRNFLKLFCLLPLLIVVVPAQAGTVTYVYTDPQGTPLAEADSDGSVTATFDYHPYGAQALGGKPSGPGYTGHVSDADSGLVYMQARYYDAMMARFLSVDLEPIKSGDPFKFNRFAYANDNPINYIDPTGLATTAALMFNLTPFGIGSFHYNVGHEFLVLRDTVSGARWVSRAGPSGNYPPYMAVSNSTAVKEGSFPIFGDPMTLHTDTSSYETSAEAADTNYYVPDSEVEIDGSIDQAVKKAKALGEKVNASNIPYKPRTTNSNAYANMVYQALTGQKAPNQEIKFPGQDTPLPVPNSPPSEPIRQPPSKDQ